MLSRARRQLTYTIPVAALVGKMQHLPDSQHMGNTKLSLTMVRGTHSTTWRDGDTSPGGGRTAARYILPVVSDTRSSFERANGPPSALHATTQSRGAMRHFVVHTHHLYAVEWLKTRGKPRKISEFFMGEVQRILLPAFSLHGALAMSDSRLRQMPPQYAGHWKMSQVVDSAQDTVGVDHVAYTR